MTDPAARWTAAPGCPAFFAYSTNYLVDVGAGIIVDGEATSAHRTEELDFTKKMIERVEERFDLKPERLIGDTAYGTAPMLAWLVQALPAGPPLTQPMARIPAPAYPRYQGRHHHLSIQPIRLRDLPDEATLLSEHADSEDRSQRP